MKNQRKKFLLGTKLLLAFLMAGTIISCSKDKDEDSAVSKEDFSKNYFNISNGEFKGEGLPASNSQTLQVLDIQGNATVLAGGSNILHISASEDAQEVIVGVKDQTGYFRVPLVADRGAANRGIFSVADLTLLIGQQVADTFTIAIAVGDGQGNFSMYEYMVVNLLHAGTGILQVSLSWDQLNDVDLHLIEPDGTEIYYGNTVSSSGGQLDVDSNPACVIDEINNENIFYEDSPEVTIPFGEYEVLVDLWANCDIAPNTNYTVVVHYGGVQIATTEGTNPFSGVLTPDDESANTNLHSIMKFTIDAAPRGTVASNNAITQKVFKFEVDKSRKAFRNFSIKK